MPVSHVVIASEQTLLQFSVTDGLLYSGGACELLGCPFCFNTAARPTALASVLNWKIAASINKRTGACFKQSFK